MSIHHLGLPRLNFSLWGTLQRPRCGNGRADMGGLNFSTQTLELLTDPSIDCIARVNRS